MRKLPTDPDKKLHEYVLNPAPLTPDQQFMVDWGIELICDLADCMWLEFLTLTDEQWEMFLRIEEAWWDLNTYPNFIRCDAWSDMFYAYTLPEYRYDQDSAINTTSPDEIIAFDNDFIDPTTGNVEYAHHNFGNATSGAIVVAAVLFHENQHRHGEHMAPPTTNPARKDYCNFHASIATKTQVFAKTLNDYWECLGLANNPEETCARINHKQRADAAAFAREALGY